MRMRDLMVLTEAGKRELPVELIAAAWVWDYRKENSCTIREGLLAWNEFQRSPLVRIHNMLSTGANGIIWLQHKVLGALEARGLIND